LLGVNRTSVYRKPKPRTTEQQLYEAGAKRRIDYWHTQMPYLGTRKIAYLLTHRDGIRIGRGLVRKYMQEIGIRALYPKPNLSKPGKGHKIMPYLLRKKPIYMPNQVWAVDITYIPLRRAHLYLTAIIDWYSRYIVGWVLSDTLEATHVIEAVKKAISVHGVPDIINSDQGSQFTGMEYQQLLKSYGIRQSMDGKGRWIDNVIIERWFRSLKVEYIYINEYHSPRELESFIANYIKEYNHLRPHQNLDNRTPCILYTTAFNCKSVA